MLTPQQKYVRGLTQPRNLDGQESGPIIRQVIAMQRYLGNAMLPLEKRGELMLTWWWSGTIKDSALAAKIGAVLGADLAQVDSEEQEQISARAQKAQEEIFNLVEAYKLAHAPVAQA